MGVGYDSLDRIALAKRQVVVCNVPGSLSHDTPAMLHREIRSHSHLSTQTMALPKSPTTLSR